MSQKFPLYLYLGTFLYTCLHFSLYVFVIRKVHILYGEKNIFLYYFWGGCLLTFLAVGFTLTVNPRGFYFTVGAIAAYGIYSISFLELWSLAQGSYSITLLTGLELDKGIPRGSIVNRFAQIGDQKKAGRLESLEKMNLVNRVEDKYQLTCFGKLFALVLFCLNWIPNLKNSG